MSLEVVSFMFIYTLMTAITFYITKTLILVNLDYSIREDRELAEDNLTINVSCLLVALIWFIYIPYILLRVIFGKTELE